MYEEQVRRQARTGAFNRRVAAHIENANRESELALGPVRAGEFFCSCGRDGCDELLTLTLEEYAFVREKPYRFLVASGHAEAVDDVIRSTGEYDVVEVKPDYRDAAAATLEEVLKKIEA